MGKKILIADDESGFVMTLRSRLEFEGCNVSLECRSQTGSLRTRLEVKPTARPVD